MADDIIGVGVAGFWHVHADDYARQVRQHSGTRLVGAWDPDEERAREGARRLGVDRAETLDALLARADLDAITVTMATNEHTDVIGRAITAGKHVFTEKLLAPTVEECEELIAAATAKGVMLVVSLPQLSEPLNTTASALVDDGELGELIYVRVRMAHDGWLGGWLPERFADPVAAIGGAFADLGCHAAYLVQRFLGAHPHEITASYGHVTGRPVEDNAVAVARYADGAVGVAEANLVTAPGAFTVELRGTQASLLFGFGGDELIGKGGRFGDEWTPVPLLRPTRTPFDLWVDAIRGDGNPTDNLRSAVDLTRFVVAANTAAATGKATAVESEGHP